MHRDIKPENFLISSTTAKDLSRDGVIVKLADFGLAKEIKYSQNMTDYVSTRWYRAPETILRAKNYN